MNNAIRKEIEKRHGGTFTRLIYKSDLTPKLKATVRHDGIRVEKVTETTSRTGCRYNKIARVIERKANTEPSNRNYTDPYEWVIPNRIKRHKEKGTEYLVMDTIPSAQANTKTKYIVYHGTDVATYDHINDIAELFTPSGLKGSGERPDVLTVKMENVMSFNKVS